MAGTITATTIQNDTSSPPTFRNNSVEIGTLCRAWVNFNGTGTVAIRASFNVSSITDNGTGDYTLNFTTAMPDANYAIVGTHSLASAGGSSTLIGGQTAGTAPTASNFRFYGLLPPGSFGDPSFFNVSVFR
jgi:hypothetical protein